MTFPAKMSIGWVGLGAMGFGMATNLIKQGHEVIAFDIFPQSLERFAAAGGTPARTIGDSAKGKSLYVCMVASAAQLNALMFESDDPLFKSLEHETTFLVASTVSATDIIRLQEELNNHGRNDILLVDSPVSGGAKRAANGTLSIMAAGSKAALAKADQILREMSDQDKLFIPGELGQGSNLKMVHQVLAAIQIATVSEALAFASWLHLDLEKVRSAVLAPESKAYSWMFENRSPRTIANHLTPPESALTIILKDTGIITESARQTVYPVPMCSTAEQIYLSGLCHGFGGEDDATLARIYMPQLKPPNKKPSQPIEDAAFEKEATNMVLILMQGIHTVAAAEAVGYANRLGLDSDMVLKLVNHAAGATQAFKEHAPSMFAKVKQNIAKPMSKPLRELRVALADVVGKARAINFPLYLGNEALAIMTATQKITGNQHQEPSIIDLVKYYDSN